MRKRMEILDPHSCFNRARDGEWLFVLLGRDPAASTAVRAWIEERIRLQKNTREDAQVKDAEEWIRTVEAEQRNDRTVERMACEPALAKLTERLASDDIVD